MAKAIAFEEKSLTQRAQRTRSPRRASGWGWRVVGSRPNVLRVPIKCSNQRNPVLKRARRGRRDYARHKEIWAHPTVCGVCGAVVRAGAADGQDDLGFRAVDPLFRHGHGAGSGAAAWTV